MSDPWSAERYLKEAANFCELAESADAPLVRAYYKSIAQRYLMRATNQVPCSRPENESAETVVSARER
jgi:hypothetical protein